MSLRPRFVVLCVNPCHINNNQNYIYGLFRFTHSDRLWSPVVYSPAQRNKFRFACEPCTSSQSVRKASFPTIRKQCRRWRLFWVISFPVPDVHANDVTVRVARSASFGFSLGVVGIPFPRCCPPSLSQPGRDRGAGLG